MIDSPIGLRDIRQPELSGWATKLSHKKLMTDHRKYCMFHDHCILWGMRRDDPEIGGCFNFLQTNIQVTQLNATSLKFELSDRERIFQFDDTSAHLWKSRIDKTIAIRLTQGNVIKTNGDLGFSSAARIYHLHGNIWDDKGVASIELRTHVKESFSDFAIFADNKTDNLHYKYLVRNKIVPKGNNAWILSQCYNMDGTFNNEVLALRFFVENDSKLFKEAFDKAFPKGGRAIPNLPENVLHKHTAFQNSSNVNVIRASEMPKPAEGVVPEYNIRPTLDKRFSDISDTSFRQHELKYLKSDEDLARHLQQMELESHGDYGIAPKKPAAYHSDDEDSLFYQPVAAIKKPVIRVEEQKAPALPVQEEGVPEISSHSVFESEGARRWLVTEIKTEVERIMGDLSGVTDIIQIQYPNPQDDVSLNIFPTIITKDCTSHEIQTLILNRLKELCVKVGGSADMVPDPELAVKEKPAFAHNPYAVINPEVKPIAVVKPIAKIPQEKKRIPEKRHNARAPELERIISAEIYRSNADVVGGGFAGSPAVNYSGSVVAAPAPIENSGSVADAPHRASVYGSAYDFNTVSVNEFQMPSSEADLYREIRHSIDKEPAVIDVQKRVSSAPSSVLQKSIHHAHSDPSTEAILKQAFNSSNVTRGPSNSASPKPQPSYDISGKFDTKPLETWDVLDVGDWLRSLKLERYVGNFDNFQIDGETLITIEETFLTSLLNVNAIHVKKIMRSLDTLKAAN